MRALACSQCKSIVYCSSECQHQDWHANHHDVLCPLIAECFVDDSGAHTALDAVDVCRALDDIEVSDGHDEVERYRHSMSHRSHGVSSARRATRRSMRARAHFRGHSRGSRALFDRARHTGRLMMPLSLNPGAISQEKACKILRDGEVRGKKLTDRQRRFFGLICSGKSPRRG